MDFVNIFITFTGRINRAKYWIAILIYLAICVIMVAIGFIYMDSRIVEGTSLIVWILMFISSIGVTIKRLHDRNKSGWYVLLFLIAPIILMGAGVVIGTMSAGAGIVATALWLIANVIYLWSFVELGCLRGTIGQNQYGPDPLAPEVLTPPVRTHA